MGDGRDLLQRDLRDEPDYEFPLLGKLARIVIWNGFIWFSVLLSIAIGGYLLLSLSPRLAMFTIVLAAALIGVSLERPLLCRSLVSLTKAA